MAISQEFQDHVAGGLTTIARCWALTRRDGVRMGFTDHDRDLEFDGLTFKADTGLTARALMQTTGLSVDNSEAVGGLSSAAITEADIRAGRYDGAEIEAWLVNWADPDQRLMQFRGTLGELARADGGFQAELSGLSEALNQPNGYVYQQPCSAVLGDGRCRFDLDAVPGYVSERPAEGVEDNVRFTFADFTGFDDRWFERGRLIVQSGAAAGLSARIKNDRLSADGREIELWEEIRAEIAPGDLLRFEAGCDKAAPTCRLKFNNFLNFRGFPDIPGEDWLMATPVTQPQNDGGPAVPVALGPGEG
ncbi:MAG TPA: DUF2163 domain-containing protein [Aliiroseovarius sp.]|nr:DUF2163 domain-containing protein [Aliiroseovarius sp.]